MWQARIGMHRVVCLCWAICQVMAARCEDKDYLHFCVSFVKSAISNTLFYLFHVLLKFLAFVLWLIF